MLTVVTTFTKILKRNGTKADFDSDKITNAIFEAGRATGEFGEEIAKRLTIRVLQAALLMIKNRTPQVEEIQDIVEEVLLESPYKKTAKAYILYREQHALIREIASKATIDLVDRYLGRIDWQVKENSNMSFSLQGLNNYLSSEVSKVYWLNKIYPKEVRKAHLEGDLHIHDLGLLSVYCVGWDLRDLLVEGFRGGEGKVESAPARHFRSALGQVVNFFYTLQGEAAGAQAFSNFDTLLAPFIRYDGLNYREVKQALQEFVFNINVPTRVGFQTPFTNVTLDLTVPSHFKDMGVIRGGKIQDDTYKEFAKEIDIFNRAFLEVLLEGDAKGRVFTFPIPTYNLTKEFDWDNKNLDLLWEITAKYGIPYFANYVNSEMSPEDARSMCCRLRIDNRELLKRGGGLFGSSPLTGSIGVVTVNMPRIGFLSGCEEEFLQHLDGLMNLARQSLEVKRKVLETFTNGNLYPYMRFYLRSVKRRFDLYWQNHFSTIGLVGMNEACENLFGETIATAKGRRFARKVLEFMRDRLVSFQTETGHSYNLEATPAEGASYRLALLDKEKFPSIKCANETRWRTGGAPFYTNSTHLPVDHTDDVFEVLELQDDLQSLYTGGTVLHLYCGQKIYDTGALKNFIHKVCANYILPYFSVTPTFSVCPQHGYIAGERRVCPKCREECEVYSRVVGYLRPVKQWNEGKREEFFLRKNLSL
jgi:anaerobic ribonucleoside-triphosphate reductase